jgi:hypothetical protein
MIETSKVARSAAITGTAAAVGLAAGRYKSVKKVPAWGAVGAGLGLSFLGLTGLGDGLAASGATVLGYRYGATGSFSKRKRLPAPVAVAAPQVPPGMRRRKRG